MVDNVFVGSHLWRVRTVSSHRVERRVTLIALDGLLSAGAFLVALTARFGFGFSDVWHESLGLPPVTLFAGLFAVTAVSCFWLAGVYRPQAFLSFKQESVDVVRGVMLLALVTMSTLYVLRLEDVSRLSLVVAFGLLIGSCLVVRLPTYRRRSAPSANRSTTHVLIVGWNSLARRYVAEIDSRGFPGFEVVGVLDERDAPEMRYLGKPRDLSTVLSNTVVDEVVICLDGSRTEGMSDVLLAAQQQGKTIRFPIAYQPSVPTDGRIEMLGHQPVMTVAATPESRMALGVKRLFDLVATLFLLIALAPILMVTGFLLLVTQGRPVFYTQVRGGLHGRPFNALKFRSMEIDAEHRRDTLLALNERVGPAFKMAEDPRITPLGRWLRRSSIDELPQLINVLKGEMSLVGPRPQPLVEVAEYTYEQRRRLSMKPGITGLWQIEARHDPSFDVWIAHDLDYIDRWSLWLDLKVLVRTPWVVVRNPGT
jgi:exopolysaccharide biosynthesis polyprenyl glycosylphosphotransferase